MTLAVVVLIVAAGCGGSSGSNDLGLGLGINLDEVAGSSVEARHRSPGVPCDHTRIPDEYGGPGLSVAMVVRCR